MPTRRMGAHVALVAAAALVTLLTLWLQEFGALSSSARTMKLHDEPAQPFVSHDGLSREAEVRWSDIFTGTNFTIGDLSPTQFRALLSPLRSEELTTALQRGELKGRDVREWLQDQRNITLKAEEYEMNLFEISGLYGYDEVAAYTLERAFAGSKLFHLIEEALCSVLSEMGTHVFLLGDSTVQGLNGVITSVARKCEPPVTFPPRTTRKDNEVTGEDGTSFYFERAYNPRFESADYSVPPGTQRTIVIANFDALHALSIFPGRKFTRMFDGRRFFDAFTDFVRYQLWQIGRLPTDTYLVTLNVNSVDHGRMKGNYADWITHYYNSTQEYIKQCAESWGTSEVTCRDGILANAGAGHLSEVIESVVPVDVDVNAITRGKGYLTPMKDGRHYKSLGHLVLVQIAVVYILQRIDQFLTQQNPCALAARTFEDK